MKTLDVINGALATVGEAPLNEADGRHPTVVSVMRLLDQVSRSVQNNKAKGYWFNREQVTLLKDVSGKVPCPSDILNVEPVDRRQDYIKRGEYLYSPSVASYILNTDVRADVVRLVAFEDLPDEAALAISDQTIWRFHSDFEGDEQKLKTISQAAGLSLKELKAAEITNSRANTRNNPQIARTISGYRAARRGLR